MNKQGDHVKVIIKLSLMLAAAAAAGCTAGSPANVPANGTPAQTPAAAASTPAPSSTSGPDSPVANVSTPAPANAADAGPVVELDSPAETYKAAYAIRQRKDVEALKQLMSKDMLAYFTEVGRSQRKSLEQALALLVEQPQAAAAETRNQRINGDRAVLEFKDASGKWLPMDFVKEDGAWKMTLSRSGGKGAKPAPKQ
jgi:predicted lipid-binding transport protein (Tim44 family)